jgi:hypothetical protein
VDWIKKHPLYALAALLAPVVGMVADIPAAWAGFTAMVGLPPCVTYSSTYYYSSGHFSDTGGAWTEHHRGGRFQFSEMNRDANYITLINRTPRVDPRWEEMLVRLPVCGGTAQWAYQNPLAWTDLYPVSRKVHPALAVEQGEFERAP